MKNKAVFLDRDGTINIDKGYVHRIEDFEFIEGAVEAIGILNENGFKVIVITNQSGIGRGYYTEKDVEKLHQYINSELAKHNARIDAFYFCPHHPTEALGKYRMECNCRKPKTGLFEKALRDFDIDAQKSYVIGNSITDIESGRKIGARTILLTDQPIPDNISDFTAKNLLSAVRLINEK
ncbi:MAG: D-glycero-beta-D-manno-heptose 1,7-bisphosphate 7-phosphatase [candidate division WOR-3 bacterium]